MPAIHLNLHVVKFWLVRVRVRPYKFRVGLWLDFEYVIG